jgi:GTP pyrophosphokinase
MVSTSVAASESQLLEGLSEAEKDRLISALEFVTPFYAEKDVITGQNALQFVRGVASTLAMLRTDIDSRIAALLFELPELSPIAAEQIEARYGQEIADLVSGIRRLMKLRETALTHHDVGHGKDAAEKAAAQMETLRKMMLAMATDMRVVLIRLASG